MIRVHVICEGQTEETFVKGLLTAHFEALGIYLYPALLGKPGHKGGNVKVDRLLTDIRNRLLGDPRAYCTTFFDFYALPPDFPGKAAAAVHRTVEEKAHAIGSGLVAVFQPQLGENAIRRFIPYVQMYEFEGLLFSDSTAFAKGIDKDHLAAEFQKIRDDFDSPEAINDSPLTAPSKRILELISDYEKPLYGTLGALEIGLATIRQECKLFNAWLSSLEGLKEWAD